MLLQFLRFIFGQGKGETLHFQDAAPSDKFFQGYFTPNNPDKYRGDCDNIFHRSSWEQKAFRFCDENPRVIAWASEELAVTYYRHGNGYPHQYYPDLMIYFADKQVVMVEIKPKEERQNPSKQNQCKWAAARQYCKEQGWQFQIWTEDTIKKIRYF